MADVKKYGHFENASRDEMMASKEATSSSAIGF